MNCQNQKCRAPKSRVAKSFDDTGTVKRWRYCALCGAKWTTDERPNASSLILADPRQGSPPGQRLLPPVDTNGQALGDSGQKQNSSAQTGGDKGGGSGIRSGPGSESDKARILGDDPWVKDSRIWAPHTWNEKYGMAWTNRYGRFYGMQSDAVACGALGDLLERLPIVEILEAQGKAKQMFAAFLASDAPRVTAAKHPFRFFVTEFGGLRLVGDDGPGDRKVPEYD